MPPLANETSKAVDVRSARMARIRGLSAVMGWICVAAAVLLTLTMLIYWYSTTPEALFQQAGLAVAPPAAIDPLVRLGALAVSMVPLGALIVGLLAARRCFALFASGHAFSGGAIRELRSFALGVAASALLKAPAGAVLSLVLSATSPGHTRSLVVNVGSDTLLALMFAAMVAVIAWVLVEATEIADENRQFI